MIVQPSQTDYDESYYRSHCGGIPYDRSEPHWEMFFGAVADSIIRELRPKTVFDAGCAKGFLVEALRKRHVEAYGRDFSEYAIHDMPHSLRPFCAVGSIAEPIEGTYDLITCIEVLEHMPVGEGETAIANLCHAAPLILFSSSPDDFTEPTHINVRTPLHWLQLFARHNFGPCGSHDPTYLCPWAMLLERRDVAPSEHELISYAKLVAYRMEKHHKTLEFHQTLQKHLTQLDIAQREVESTRHEIDRLSHSHLKAEQEVDRLRAIERSTTWRMTAPLRGLINRASTLRRALRANLSKGNANTTATDIRPDRIYQTWIDRFDALKPQDMKAMQDQAETFVFRPLISILMPTYNTPERVLREAIDSVIVQTYGNWELCIADDASHKPHVRAILDEYASKDARIRLVYREKNGHISAASNSALAIAQGEWLALLDHDDLLAPHALFCVVEAINRNPDARLIYSDEDKIDMDGKRHDPYFKSDWNEVLFLGQNMFSHLGVIRRDLVQSVGGFREGFEGAQDYDLILRCIEKVERSQIIHVPHVLYHWRMIPGSTALDGAEKPYAHIAAQKALNEHYVRMGLAFESIEGAHPGANRPSPRLEREPSVVIIIPTRNGLGVLRSCVESVLKRTEYKNYRILIVDNGSDDPATLAYLERRKGDRVDVLVDDRPFNYSQINNFAVSKTSSDYICFLNNDTEVLSPGWLKEMVGLSEGFPKAGVIGAKLLYPDRTVQHAGVVLSLGGVAGHNAHFDEHHHGYFGRAVLSQEYSAVTFACALVRRAIFDEVGGLDEDALKVAFNDVDFCLKVREAGYRNIWTPNAVLLHFESKSRGIENTPAKKVRFKAEVETMLARWGDKLRDDPAYSPNLSLEIPFEIAFPPRVEKPWCKAGAAGRRLDTNEGTSS